MLGLRVLGFYGLELRVFGRGLGYLVGGGA